ncbi:hypothetical protein AWM68_13210 [Fictibacillus phosphorivorans]|uniref:Uncharacterized protein n=1 Tax=Fictibacillus phosphorivorans TaxID=1221500 RepID=A0A165MZN9_9BACL|nr:hypothetical protein [Fictibacillus phosphorivorans]KZE64060.1 hypothetical protein AWM68_13210 [Fictibacillus phosphorivorans]
MNYKKVILGIIAVIVVSLGSYYGVHSYANSKIKKSYAEGFEKNALGDYCKNRTDMVLCVYEAPLFQSYTNLSVTNIKDKVDLIIWVPLYGGNLRSGIIVTDDAAERSYEIEVDQNFKTDDKEYQEILDQNQEAIDVLKSVVKEEWNTEL